MPAGEPSDRLRLEYRTDNSVVIVDVDGETDLFTAALLRDRLLALVGEGHTRLVVNLGSVSFIDSTGLGVLVGVWHRLSPADGVLALAAPSAQVRALLEATGLSTPFPIYENTAEAGASLASCRVGRLRAAARRPGRGILAGADDGVARRSPDYDATTGPRRPSTQ